MLVAYIVPTAYMKEVADKDFHLLLAHLCSDPEYVENAKNLKGYKILDNSAYELGASVSLKYLIDCAKAVGAHELVLPDVMGDSEATLMLVKESIPIIKEQLPNVNLMAVPQGKDLSDWLNCYTELLKIKEVGVIGFNKNTDKISAGNRIFFCNHLYENGLIDKRREYHLLGLPDLLNEIHWQGTKNTWIRSMDTSAIFTISQERKIMKYMDSRPTTSINFNIAYVPTVATYLLENIKIADNWRKGGASKWL